jgi:hypothetical protein
MREYTYERTWEQIKAMLDDAELEKNRHKLCINDKHTPMRKKAQHMRDYKGLQGVCYSLRWVLGDMNMTRDILLGRDGL